jgi:hypothetical protein
MIVIELLWYRVLRGGPLTHLVIIIQDLIRRYTYQVLDYTLDPTTYNHLKLITAQTHP